MNVKGFIAQEVEVVVPEAVSVKDESATGGLEDARYLETQSFIPILVRAVQELSESLKAANARIAQLEAIK